jgi:hypothetical protein
MRDQPCAHVRVCACVMCLAHATPCGAQRVEKPLSATDEDEEPIHKETWGSVVGSACCMPPVLPLALSLVLLAARLQGASLSLAVGYTCRTLDTPCTCVHWIHHTLAYTGYTIHLRTLDTPYTYTRYILDTCRTLDTLAVQVVFIPIFVVCGAALCGICCLLLCVRPVFVFAIC